MLTDDARRRAQVRKEQHYLPPRAVQHDGERHDDDADLRISIDGLLEDADEMPFFKIGLFALMMPPPFL